MLTDAPEADQTPNDFGLSGDNGQVQGRVARERSHVAYGVVEQKLPDDHVPAVVPEVDEHCLVLFVDLRLAG